jgi:transcriptional regulator with XRE-family HTH domain
MGNPRPRPHLLPEKLLAIRTFLNFGQPDMADKLQFEIGCHSGRQLQLHPGRISEYESGQREPNLFVLLAYARLGQVHMESLVDDDIEIDTFRTRLGNEVCYFTTSPAHLKPGPVKKTNKPVTLLSGTH